MDASGADKLILLVQTNQVLYDKSAAGYKVKDALEKGDILHISVDIAVNSERTTDLRCRFSFLVSRWRCDRSVRFIVSRFSFLVSRFSFLGGSVTGPLHPHSHTHARVHGFGIQRSRYYDKKLLLTFWFLCHPNIACNSGEQCKWDRMWFVSSHHHSIAKSSTAPSQHRIIYCCR